MNAPEKATELKAAITAVIAFITTLIGWKGIAALIWLGCIFLDYIAGTMAAKKERNWSSAAAREGLWHKAGEILAVMVAALCDIALGTVISGTGIQLPFDVSTLITPVVLTWYILTELGSIMENCGKLGAPVPKWFKQYVDKARKTIDVQKDMGQEENQRPETAYEEAPEE